MFATITIERADQEIEVEVLGSYQSGACGARDRYGLPLEPDQAGEIEIIEVGGGFTLTGAEEEQAIQVLREAMEKECDPGAERW